MGKRGPKPESKEKLELKGSWRAKHCPDKISLPKKQLRAPRWLSDPAKEQWRRIAPRLIEIGLLNEFSRDWWAMFSELFADYIRIEKQTRESLSGSNKDLFGGSNQLDPLKIKRLLSLKHDLARQIMSSLKEANLSPDVLQIDLTPVDPLDELIKKQQKRKFFGD